MFCSWQIIESIDGLFAAKVDDKKMGEAGAALRLPIG